MPDSLVTVNMCVLVQAHSLYNTSTVLECKLVTPQDEPATITLHSAKQDMYEVMRKQHLHLHMER